MPNTSTLTWSVRASAGLAYAAAAAACLWALAGDRHAPAPHTGVLVCVWAAVAFSVARAVLLGVRRRSAPGVTLEKGRAGRGSVPHVPPDHDSERWAKARQLAAWALVLLCSTATVTSFAPPGKAPATAGATAEAATQAVPWVVFALTLLTLGPLFSLVPPGELLRGLAWSPAAQWTHACAAALAAVGLTALLTGHDTSGPLMVLAGLGPFILPATYVLMGVRVMSLMPDVE